MSPVGTVKISFNTKILLLIGILITVLMIVISFFILLEWRNLEIESRTQSASDVTKAFSITVLDALIYAESTSSHLEEQLETQIEDFLQKVEDIKYISILDNNRRIIAHSDLTKYNKVLNDSISIIISKTKSPISSIYESDEYGWVIETVFPLQIAGKRWGIIRVGVDAEPLPTYELPESHKHTNWSSPQLRKTPGIQKQC